MSLNLWDSPFLAIIVLFQKQYYNIALLVLKEVQIHVVTVGDKMNKLLVVVPGFAVLMLQEGLLCSRYCDLLIQSYWVWYGLMIGGCSLCP